MKQYTQDQVLKAVKNSYGIMSDVAVSLGCAWHTANKYVRKWPEAEDAFQREAARLDSLAYTSFRKAIEIGERWAVERVLDTSARRDGHGIVTRQAIDHTSGGEKIEGVTVEFISAPKPKQLPPPPKELPAKAKAPTTAPVKPKPKPAPEPPPKPQAQGKPPPPPPAKPKSYREAKRQS